MARKNAPGLIQNGCMKFPTPNEINNYRKLCFRPVVVGCFVNAQKILLAYKKKHNLWQLPQGGVENKETLEAAFKREMGEELSLDFVEAVAKILYLGQDRLEFPAWLHGSRELLTDEGEKVVMKGKMYFFLLAETSKSQIDLTQTEFDDYRWFSFSEAKKAAEEIYQAGKRKITLKALDLI